MAEKTVPARAQDKAPLSSEETRSQERYITPPVDIYETADGLVVKADLPGVDKEGLDVRVEHNLLTIRGKAAHTAPGDPIYRADPRFAEGGGGQAEKDRAQSGVKKKY